MEIEFRKLKTNVAVCKLDHSTRPKSNYVISAAAPHSLAKWSVILDDLIMPLGGRVVSGGPAWDTAQKPCRLRTGLLLGRRKLNRRQKECPWGGGRPAV